MFLKSKIKILLADDHPMMLKGMYMELEEIGYKHMSTATDGSEALHCLQHDNFDLAILDIEMPGKTGFEIIESLSVVKKKLPIILLSYHKEKSYLALARKLGVKGYMLKEDSIAELSKCIHQVIQGKEYYSEAIRQIQQTLTEELRSLDDLTRSERTILKYLAKGLTSLGIAENLGLSKRTVQKHRSNIHQKLNTDLQGVELGQWAIENQQLIERLQ